MKFSTFIFDFDGTLVDSMPTWSRKMLHVLEHYGVSYPDDIIQQITPLGDLGSVRYFRETLGVEATAEEMIARMDAFALPKYRDEIGWKDGVYDCLKALKEQGCRLHILTASPHKMLDPCLERLGVADWFDHIWSCDDFGTTKSDPQIYQEALRRIGSRAEETVFLDDNLLALRTAAQAGLCTVGVYDPSGVSFEAQMRQEADLYVQSLSEVIPWAAGAATEPGETILFQAKHRKNEDVFKEVYGYHYYKRPIMIAADILLAVWFFLSLGCYLGKLHDNLILVALPALIALWQWLLYYSAVKSGSTRPKDGMAEVPEFTLTVTEQTILHESTAGTRMELSCNKLKKAHELEHYLMLQGTEKQVFVFAKDGFCVGSYDEFLSFLKEKGCTVR